MIDFLIHKPVSVIMVFVALLLLGLVAVKRIPISPLPDVDIPEIIIHINKNNISANELEAAVINRLRTMLVQTSGVEDIRTETRDAYSLIRLRFKYGTDINYAFLEVNEKVDLSMNSFPRDMERPRVIKSSVGDLPVFYLSLKLKHPEQLADPSAKFLELSSFTEQVIKRRLEQLPEIAFVDVTGTSSSEIFISPDEASVRALKLNENDFRRILERNNLASGNVQIQDGQLQYNIKFASSSASSLDDIRSILFSVQGRIFRLGDIAKIGIRQRQPIGMFISGQRPAINLAIIKQKDTRMDDLRKNVNNMLKLFRKNYQEIDFEQTQDQTELLEFSISNLKQDLYLGSLLAFILMFFFLKNIRSPLLIGITIPVSLILSILFFTLFGISINIISLSGLVLGVGLMIDNSIIVIDNISQFREREVPLFEACVKGTNEIIRPMISSCLTTCSVFLPLIFLSGISGALFYDQAMAITIGLSVSLIISIVLLPVLYCIFHRGKVKAVKADFFERFGITFFERIYEKGFHWVFRNKKITLIIVSLLIASNIFLFKHLKKEKLPRLEDKELIAYIDWNQNITLEENQKRLGELLKAIGERYTRSNAMIGTQEYLLDKGKSLSLSQAELYLKAANASYLGNIGHIIQLFFHEKYPQAVFQLSPPKTIFEKVFGDDEPELIVQLKPKDNDYTNIVRVEGIISGFKKRFPKLNISGVGTQQLIVLKADPEKMILYGLNINEIYERLKTALNINQISSVRSGGQETPIVINNNSKYLNEIVSSLTIRNDKGVEIPLYDFVDISKEESFKTLYGDKKGSFIPLSVETEDAGQVVDYARKVIKSRQDFDVDFRGSYFSNKQLITEMAVVLLVSVLLLYFILAAQFESIVQPLIVLFELPISMSGALIMLFLFSSSINLISMIGLVVMGGIIINDSILKIDAINNLRRNKGYALMDAIHEGGLKRLKSIIMTSMVTILSVAPFLFGTDMGSVLQRPLSLVLIGGMLIGTPVSLYFIPLVYWFYYRKKEKAVERVS